MTNDSPLIPGVPYEDQPGLSDGFIEGEDGQEIDVRSIDEAATEFARQRPEILKQLDRVNELLEAAERMKKPKWLAHRIADFQAACIAGEEIYWDRGSQYGDATAETGLLGAAITLTTDVARIRGILLNLENLTKLVHGDQELRKSLEDALLDAHNYAAIAYYWLKTDNIFGAKNE